MRVNYASHSQTQVQMLAHGPIILTIYLYNITDMFSDYFHREYK